MPRRVRVSAGTEQPQRQTPWSSVLLATSGVLPLVVGTAASLAAPARPAAAAEAATLRWGAAILLFLAGVRRGLAFREPGGPTVAQVASSIGLFLPGVASLFVPRPRGAAAVLAAGFAGVAVLDPVAAGRGEAPVFFARLRPVQAGVAVLALLALWGRRRG